MYASRRTKSVPTIPERLYIEPRARIDTWQRRRARSVSDNRAVCK